MTEKQKKIIAILGTLFILCSCCGGGVFWVNSLFRQGLITDPVQVRRLGHEIATYTLPEGYNEWLGFDFLTAKIIAIVDNPASPEMMIFLMHVPVAEGVNPGETEQQLQGMMQHFNVQAIDFSFDRSEPRLINGETVDLSYHTGTDGAGVRYRQVTGLFESERGKVIILAQGPESDWDQGMLDHLLDSIR